MTIVSSNVFLKVLDTAIPLNDGIPNWWKEEYGLSTNDPTLATNYPPADSQLTYLEKYLYGLNPLTNDTDGDGLTDYDEIFIYHTNPLQANTAGDGIPDGWKVQFGLNPLVADANNVAGFDGITYMQVYQYNLTHTNPLNPNAPFAVGSGFSNYELINNGQHTNNFITTMKTGCLALNPHAAFPSATNMTATAICSVKPCFRARARPMACRCSGCG